jgi:hypothetical protein
MLAATGRKVARHALDAGVYDRGPGSSVSADTELRPLTEALPCRLHRGNQFLSHHGIGPLCLGSFPYLCSTGRGEECGSPFRSYNWIGPPRFYRSTSFFAACGIGPKLLHPSTDLRSTVGIHCLGSKVTRRHSTLGWNLAQVRREGKRRRMHRAEQRTAPKVSNLTAALTY